MGGESYRLGETNVFGALDIDDLRAKLTTGGRGC